MSSGRAAWDGPRQSKEYPLHVKTIACLTKEQVLKVLALAKDMKAAPHKYASALKQKTLLMLFEKPSLRTRVSFETGMTQLGGHAIHYNIADSPLGKKESIQVGYPPILSTVWQNSNHDA
jgi:ornithine carbamoyltransferase